MSVPLTDGLVITAMGMCNAYKLTTRHVYFQRRRSRGRVIPFKLWTDVYDFKGWS